MRMAWIDLLAVFLLIISAIGMRPVQGDTFINKEYLSVGTGKVLRGFFALVVIFHHLALRVTVGSLFHVFTQAGYLAVAVYFFLSGYGLQKSHMASEDYSKRFLLKRLPKILSPYAVVTVLYWIANMCNGVVYSMGEIFAALQNGTPIVSFSWYINCICCFYVAYWLFMSMCRKHYFGMILCACLWLAAYIVVCRYLGRSKWWYNTPQLLILGMIWAVYEQKILRIIKKYYFAAVSVTATALIAADIAKHTLETHAAFPSLTMLTAVFFVLLILLLSMKVTLTSRILSFLGKISMELYLIHGLWINVLRSELLYIQDDSLWAFAVVGSSIVSALILHQAMTGFCKWMERCAIQT